MFAAVLTGRVSAMLLLGIAALVSGIAQADDAPFGDRGSMWRKENYVGALRHMGEIYFARTVRRGDTVSDLPRGTMMRTSPIGTAIKRSRSRTISPGHGPRGCSC
jgi:hypothetical protein